MIPALHMTLLAAVLALAVTGAGQTKSQSSVEPAKEARESDIREAVLRRLMRDWVQSADKSDAESKAQTERGIFFVSVNHKDPRDDFLKRFQNIPRTVKKISASKISKGFPMAVVDKETQERGIVFRADGIRWLGKTHVEVEGGYNCDGLCGAGFTFDVWLENGEWIVKKQKTNWVS